MNIKKIRIDAFGKFVDKKIKFKKGINVIYGDNETGKSTIHKFIETMLFGINPSEKDLYSKYKPWFSEEYKGQLIMNEKDNEFFIYRDFENNISSLNKEDIKDLNPNSLEQPGYKLLGVNKDIYINTLSIGQLNSKTDRELLKEIKNKIENLGKSKDQNIDLKNVLKRLEEKVDEDRYKEILDKINILKNKKNQIEDKRVKFKKIIKQIRRNREELDDLEKRNELLEPLTSINDFTEFKNKYVNAEKVINEIKTLNKEIESMQRDMDIEIEDYEKLIVLSSKNEKLEDESIKLKEDIESFEKEAIYIKNDFQKFKGIHESNFISQYELYKSNKKILQRLQLKLDDLDNSIKEIEEKNYQGIIDSFNEISKETKRKKYIKGILEGNIVNLLKIKLKKERNRKWVKIVLSLLIIMGVPISSYFAVNYYDNPMIYYGNVLVFLGFIVLSKLSRDNKIIRSLKKEIKEINQRVPQYKEECEKLEEHKKEILDKYGCVNIKDLKSLYYEAIDNKKSVEEKNKTNETLQEEIFYLNKKCREIEDFLTEYLNKFGYSEISEENIKKINKKYNESEVRYNSLEKIEKNRNLIKEKHDSIKKELKDNKNEINTILNISGVESKDEFKEAFKIQNILKEKVSLKSNKEEVLRNILQDEDYEEIKNKYKSIKKIKEKEKFSSFEDIKEEKNIVEEEIKKISNLIERYKKEICKIEEHKRLYLIEEEMSDLDREKREIEKTKEIVELSKNNIIETSKKIKEEFMPELEKSLAKYFKILTDGKYEEVKIEENFDIKIKESDKDKQISVDNLSLGAIDQLYFSLRFSLIDVMFSNSKIPIVLDDCFTQYDDERLKNALEIIVKMKEQYQILLFTCHKREENILKELEEEVNIIQL